MITKNIYYQEEKKYVASRLLFLIVITILSFILFERTGDTIIPNAFMMSMTIAGVLIFSLLHYAFVVRKPQSLITLRKNLLVIVDLVALTVLVWWTEQHGIYLLPLFVWIVMWSASSFGITYFYTSITTVAVSWVALLVYSSYWLAHYDVLLAFTLTTFLVPLYYLKYIVRVHAQNSELTQVLSSTTKDARHDELTGVANRKVYKEEMKQALKSREFFALCFIDLNKFKVINDTHGHHIGDEVLKEVVRRLENYLGEEDFLARLGGDEFVIITKRKKVFLQKFIQRLEESVIGKFQTDGLTVPIELSIGISMFPDDSKTEMMLSKFADEAMYIAKKNKDTYHKFYSELTEAEKNISN